MPTSPARGCLVPRCPGFAVRDGRCRLHRVGRGSRTARGYDEDWQRLRAWFLSQPGQNLCTGCRAVGVVRFATDVDHIIPFESIEDPRRLDPTNLQPLCSSCHGKKTRKS